MTTIVNYFKKCEIGETTSRALIPAFFILLFCYAALSKLLVFGDFRDQLHNQNIPYVVAETGLYLLPSAELLTCLLLIVPAARKYGLWLALFLLLVFTGYIGLVLLHVWSRIPCSCGGILSRLSWKGHFLFNVVCLILNIIALIQEPQSRSVRV